MKAVIGKWSILANSNILPYDELNACFRPECMDARMRDGIKDDAYVEYLANVRFRPIAVIRLYFDRTIIIHLSPFLEKYKWQR